MLYHQNLDWKYVSYVVKSNAQTCHYGHETKEFCTVLAKKIYRSIHHNGKMCFSILRTPIPYEGIISKWMGRWWRDYYDSIQVFCQNSYFCESRGFNSITLHLQLGEICRATKMMDTGHLHSIETVQTESFWINKIPSNFASSPGVWYILPKYFFLKSCCQHLQSSYLKSKIHYN